MLVCFLITLVSFLGTAVAPCHAQPIPPDWLKSAVVEGFSGRALSGKYNVWEDREAKTGRQLRLNVVVIPARSSEPQPDPIFHLAGGPGQGATQTIGPMMQYYASLAEDRDIVFVDQRGTGESAPLDCPHSTPDDLQSYFTEFYPDEFVRNCLANQVGNVAFYTTPFVVDDIDDIRDALGYEKINLWGRSYGTRTAQVYMKRHPESVRTAVMHGVTPIDVANPLPFAKALDRGVELTIEACMQDEACAGAYPELRSDWERSKRYFDDGPVAATVEHPITGIRGEVEFMKGTYADGVRHILYSVDASAHLPAMIHDAANGNFDAFAQRELSLAIGYADMLSRGVFLTVTCAEDVRFISEDDILRETDGTFLGDYRVRRQLAACNIWGWGTGIDETYQEPVRIDAPVLIFSGELDTGTPPEGGERVASTLPHALHVVFPNQSHVFANIECEAQITTDFIRNGSQAFNDLDLSCVDESKRTPFAILPM